MIVFSNRELAQGLWYILFLVWCYTKTEIRIGIQNLIKAFCVKEITIPIGLMFLYITIIIIWLYRVNLWNISQLKNTILWFIFTAIISFLNISSIAEKSDYFITTVKKNLKFLVVIEFLISFYSFDFWIEFILFPIISILAAMLVLAQSDNKYKIVEKFIHNISLLLGSILILYTLYKLITDFNDFAQINTVYDFITPLILTFLFLPFIYFLVIFINYEKIFFTLELFINDSSLIKYAKFNLIIKFKTNIELVKRWLKSLSYREEIKTKNDLDSSISEIFAMKAAEENPQIIPLSKGWSPYSAKNFLVKKDIKTGYYHPDKLGKWFACSPYKNLIIDQEIIPNNIAYYINGNSSIANELKIVLNINEKDSAIYAHKELLDYAKILYSNSLFTEIPSDFEDAILNGYDKIYFKDNKEISIIKKCWSNSQKDGYDIKFIIKKV